MPARPLAGALSAAGLVWLFATLLAGAPESKARAARAIGGAQAASAPQVPPAPPATAVQLSAEETLDRLVADSGDAEALAALVQLLEPEQRWARIELLRAMDGRWSGKLPQGVARALADLLLRPIGEGIGEDWVVPGSASMAQRGAVRLFVQHPCTDPYVIAALRAAALAPRRAGLGRSVSALGLVASESKEACAALVAVVVDPDSEVWPTTIERWLIASGGLASEPIVAALPGADRAAQGNLMYLLRQIGTTTPEVVDRFRAYARTIPADLRPSGHAKSPLMRNLADRTLKAISPSAAEPLRWPD